MTLTQVSRAVSAPAGGGKLHNFRTPSYANHIRRGMDSRAKVLHMAAAHGQIVISASSPPLADEVAGVLGAFERTTGLHVCFRAMSDRWREPGGELVVPPPYLLHRSRFCERQKARDLAACIRCDHEDLPRVCRPGDGPMVRTCHAGADEVLVPLWSEGVLTAVVFVGQFQRARRSAGKVRGLTTLSSRDGERLRTLGLPLRSYLLDVLHRLDDQRRETTAGRRGAIDRYIRRELASGPTLAGLAAALSLSPSRTSHVVRELTGQTFQQHVEARRLAVARDLLAGSGGKVAWVAQQAGFADVAYFCRYFRRKTGTTPTTFRRLHRRVASA